MSKVSINGKDFNVYDGKGEPEAGQVAILVIPLKKSVRKYQVNKDKNDKNSPLIDKESVTYAEVGSRFAGMPLPCPKGVFAESLAYKLTIYPTKSNAVASEVVGI